MERRYTFRMQRLETMLKERCRDPSEVRCSTWRESADYLFEKQTEPPFELLERSPMCLGKYVVLGYHHLLATLRCGTEEAAAAVLADPLISQLGTDDADRALCRLCVRHSPWDEMR